MLAHVFFFTPDIWTDFSPSSRLCNTVFQSIHVVCEGQARVGHSDMLR
jgi:hypothetical protein